MPVAYDQQRVLALQRQLRKTETALANLIGAEVPRLYAPPDLSARELDVLNLAATGMEEKEIGEWLMIGIHTVRTHKYALLRKWGTRNTTQTVVMGLLTGVLSEADVAAQIVAAYPQLAHE